MGTLKHNIDRVYAHYFDADVNIMTQFSIARVYYLIGENDRCICDLAFAMEVVRDVTEVLYALWSGRSQINGI